ncbi:peptide chain release factor N(5)-glutamine methyltransferase [Pseudooceanicola sp. 216_PA32_1]|uniref:Release factor glutamine methyltransferase n=1 Tax=Pseudooceanicola pacificus TaxID=2676438 RepID=A0A844WBK4_9RHOB|nr:peptide chain release factor N(5)-glutamine methyltransferase [Pseudooceanicola pacificus]MWB77352.1 peptide chain release factor N(5)-glutamine methyltransferase [Pseudooceanicola pacificus]
MSDTLATALRAAVARLAGAGLPDAPRDARALVAAAAGLPPDRLTIEAGSPWTAQMQAALDLSLARRIAREPVTRILGHRLFWGRRFAVTPDVLDPRPDTETVIAAALEGGTARRVLDLGTGSGILALTLLAEWPGATALATDVSPAALAVAQGNADALGLGDRVSFLHSDWFAAVAGRFDMIVSNPPYVSEAEMAGLDPEVALHDPRQALTPGGDGLDPYRVIAAQAAAHLQPGGRLLVEIGWRQGPAVAALFQGAGLEAIAVHPDMEGRDRCIAARRSETG